MADSDYIRRTEERKAQPIHEVGDEVLDDHIYDDHGDPHTAALNDVNADGRVMFSTWVAVFFLGFTFLSSLAFTLNTFAPVAPIVAMELQGSVRNLNWVAGGWSLGGSVAFAIAGQLSDYLGRKYVIAVGQAFLLVGHLLGATAQSFSQIIAAMVTIGVGTGTTFVIYPGISEILPNKWRAFGIATTEVILLLFGAFGPLMGRALTQNATWRWIFILGDISGVIAMAGTLFFYRPPRRIFQDRTKRQVLHELDYFGIFLYSVGVTLCLLALGWAGTQYRWSSPAVIAPLVIGVCLFVLTFAWGFKGYAKRPLFPYRLFSRFREYNSLLIINFATGLAHVVLATFVPQQISYIFTSNPITAGWYNLPSSFGICIGGILLGALIPKIKYMPIQLLVANALQTLGCGLLAIATPNRIAAGLVIQAIANIPFTWILILCYTTVGLHIPQRDIGLSYGLLGSFRYLGGAVGSTIFNTILTSKVAKSVPREVAKAVIPLGYPANQIDVLIRNLSSRVPTALSSTPPDVVAAAREAVRWGYADAFCYVWYASIPFFVIACVVSPFVADASAYLTNHTAVVTTYDESRKDHPVTNSNQIKTSVTHEEAA